MIALSVALILAGGLILSASVLAIRPENPNACLGIAGLFLGHKFISFSLTHLADHCLRCGAPYEGGRRG